MVGKIYIIKINFRDFDITNWKNRKKSKNNQVGYVPQNTNLNIDFPNNSF